ncbi:hypothetical protein [Thauera humireducens]|uniref:hypothetical protein n=1 Tax=Thauera humireducens TaxID=1134435 RepID=UPI00311EFA4E
MKRTDDRYRIVTLVQLDTHPVINEMRLLVANVVHRAADRHVLVCANVTWLGPYPTTLELIPNARGLASEPCLDPIVKGWHPVTLTLRTFLRLSLTQCRLFFRLITGEHATQRIEYITR